VDTDAAVIIAAAATEIVRRARLRGLGEDESVPLHGGRAAFRRDEVQAEAERGTGRGRRNRRYSTHITRPDSVLWGNTLQNSTVLDASPT